MPAKSLLYALPVTLALTTGATAATHDFTLENGLRVIVSEDRRAPTAAVRLTYRIGSHQEYPGLTGVSRVLERLAAKENASTSHDATAYFQTVHKERLEAALVSAANTSSAPTLDAADFTDAMQELIDEHVLRINNDPEAQALATLHAQLFPTSGYRTPPSGSLVDLERLTLDDIKQWHANWYAPNNAILAIVGDIELNQVKALVKRHFGPLQRRSLPVSRIPLEAEAPGERSLSLQFPNVKPRLYLAFNWPSYATSADHQQIAALRLLPYLLTESPDARLHSRLMRDEEVLDNPVSQYLPLRRGASYFMITSHLAANTTQSVALAKVWEQLHLLHTHPPTLEELDRARHELQARHGCYCDQQQARAAELSELAVAELPLDLPRREREALALVTPEDIRDAARLWLTRERSSVAYLHTRELPHEPVPVLPGQ